MALRLVRQSSDTPNITNKDDVKMVRYAYGGFDGVVKNFGQELAATEPVYGVFRIESGRVVLQGWEVDIDEGGWETTLFLPPTNIYYLFYLEINALLETAEIKSIYGLSMYPEISAGDDLTEVPNGVARLPLFKFTLESRVVTDFQRLVKVIPYAKDEFLTKSKFESVFEPDQETVKKATTADNAIKRSNSTYTGFVGDVFNGIKAPYGGQDYCLKLFVKMDVPTVTVEKKREAVAIGDSFYDGSHYRCRYSLNGVTQGFFDILPNSEENYSQLFTVSYLTDPKGSIATYYVRFYKDNGVLYVYVPMSTYGGIRLVLDHFEHETKYWGD